MFDIGHWTKIEPFTNNEISLKTLIHFQNWYKRRQLKKTKSLAASSALLKEGEFYCDYDDRLDKRIPTREELNYIKLELEKFTDYQSEYNMWNFYLKQTTTLIHLS